MHPLPQNTAEWLAEIADAYADAHEALPFMPLVDVQPDERHLFHMAPRVALKFRGLPNHRVDTATEAALSSYVASKDQVGAALDNPHVAFSFCYLAAHLGLEIVSYETINEVMAFIEENKDILTHLITHRTHKEMTELDQPPIIHSPLAQSVTRDGKTVHVEIYEDGAGGWLLEVVDEYGNSTVWDDPFSADQAALDEVLKTIAEDGIASLIGSPPNREEMLDVDQPLTEAELNELDDFLADSADEDTSMDVSMLEGFLTAIAIGPRIVRPSEWLPWVWDKEEGIARADYESLEQANRITSTIMRLYNAVVHSFMTDPASFEPIFWRAIQWGAAEWSEGFITGFQFNDEAWTLLAAGQPTWFTPFLRLGTDEGIDLTKKESDAERWMNEIEPSLVRIHAYWEEMRAQQPPDLVEDEYHDGGPEAAIQFVRGGPKIGRNDPCPCGSGKKFKKCCGADGATPLLH